MGNTPGRRERETSGKRHRERGTGELNRDGAAAAQQHRYAHGDEQQQHCTGARITRGTGSGTEHDGETRRHRKGFAGISSSMWQGSWRLTRARHARQHGRAEEVQSRPRRRESLERHRCKGAGERPCVAELCGERPEGVGEEADDGGAGLPTRGCGCGIQGRPRAGRARVGHGGCRRWRGGQAGGGGPAATGGEQRSRPGGRRGGGPGRAAGAAGAGRGDGAEEAQEEGRLGPGRWRSRLGAGRWGADRRGRGRLGRHAADGERIGRAHV